MTLKIETASGGHTASLRLIGRIEAEYLDELAAHAAALHREREDSRHEQLFPAPHFSCGIALKLTGTTVPNERGWLCGSCNS